MPDLLAAGVGQGDGGGRDDPAEGIRHDHRSDGKLQATYDGHPLYTYVADSSAGMTSGNGKNLSGGLWWAMTPSGAKLAATASGSSPSSSTGGGGYGY